MSRCIVKIKNKYFEWSTIVDAPVTYGMTQQELFDYIADEYGKQGLINFPQRLKRVEQYGTSMLGDTSLKDTISINRAGENEKEISIEEIYQKYHSAPLS